MPSLPPIGAMVSIKFDAQGVPDDFRGELFEVTGYDESGAMFLLELEGYCTGHGRVYPHVSPDAVLVEELPQGHNDMHIVNMPWGQRVTCQVIWRGNEPRPPRSSLKVYVVSIGWENTYFYPQSTREEYDTCNHRLRMARVYNEALAREEHDAIIEHRYVYAHEIAHVRRCYPELVEDVGRPVFMMLSGADNG